MLVGVIVCLGQWVSGNLAETKTKIHNVIKMSNKFNKNQIKLTLVLTLAVSTATRL